MSRSPIFNVANMSLNDIRKNKILAKNSEFTANAGKTAQPKFIFNMHYTQYARPVFRQSVTSIS